MTLADGEVVRGSTGTSYINTGAFMSNFIARFAFDRFQPYFGAGVGVYYAESAGTDITTPRGTFSSGGGASHTDLAWQVIAGADYYWNPKFSTFIEYHYLDYTSSQIETGATRDLGQHLVGAGVPVPLLRHRLPGVVTTSQLREYDRLTVSRGHDTRKRKLFHRFGLVG